MTYFHKNMENVAFHSKQHEYIIQEGKRNKSTYSIVWVEDVGGRGIVNNDDLVQVPA